MRPAWAEVDLAAIRENAAVLAGLAAPARLCAVVKANGYGHGAVPAAAAALEGGAAWLAVATVEEGAELRDAGIDAPVLLLSEPDPADAAEAVARAMTPTVYTAATVVTVAAAAAAAGSARVGVHLKVDTGMHRVGADPLAAVELAEDIAGRPELVLEGLWTHLAVADEPEHPFTAEQLARFEKVRHELAGRGIEPELVHAANSAGAIAHPGSRHDLVRAGIAVYGLASGPDLGLLPGLRPALALKARITHVRRLPTGEGVSYGLRWRTDRPTTIATVPIGYADGVTRRLSATGGEVLVGGRRRPIAGTVTMDQIMVDCGDDGVGLGDEVVLIGDQGDERISAEEWARRLDTITYEVVTGIGPRVPRVYA